MFATSLANNTGDVRLGHALALIVAVACGTTLPDVDQLPTFGLLRHRDAMTHSLLPALILLGFRRQRAVAAGLALGLALHLAADVFPEAMVGYATVKLPFAGAIGGWSYPWLGANALAGALMFGVLLPSLHFDFRLVLAILVAAALFGANYLLRVDGGWWALASILLIGWGVSRLSESRATGR